MSIHISYMSTKALRDHIGQLEAERKLVEPSRQWSVISALSVRIDNAKTERVGTAGFLITLYRRWGVQAEDLLRVD